MLISLCPALSEDLLVAENTARIATFAQEAAAHGSELILFGEAYLQGFEAMVFNYEVDVSRAVCEQGCEIAHLRRIAKDCGLAIGFGFFENDKGALYSSYLIIDAEGKTAAKYQRVSTGWRYPYTCPDYREGKSFAPFRFKDKTFAILICGDFWEDSLLAAICELDPLVDAFLWPVNCDYSLEDWEKNEKFAYAERTALLAKPVLFVNNNRLATEAAKGGAFLWRQGQTLRELPYGTSGLLTVEI